MSSRNSTQEKSILSDLKTQSSKGYELLDSGDGRKLERFGKFMLDRPSPQAIWQKNPKQPWSKADAFFERQESGNGQWLVHNKKLPEAFSIAWQDMVLEIRLTAFGNVGLFPEHSAHFPWMRQAIQSRPEPTVLNLFAYTGAASMMCAKAGAKVTHVDAAKAVNTWAKVNMDTSSVPEGSMRLITDDALKFVRREQRRDRKYDGIILDPPTYGRGPKGEIWKVDRDFQPFLEECLKLLSPNPLFVLVTSHSPGITPSVLRALLRSDTSQTMSGEMLIDGTPHPMPAGCFARLTP